MFFSVFSLTLVSYTRLTHFVRKIPLLSATFRDYAVTKFHPTPDMSNTTVPERRLDNPRSLTLVGWLGSWSLNQLNRRRGKSLSWLAG